MKCLSCDKILTDFEATRKFVGSGTYVELCNKCVSTVDLPPTIERLDLMDEDIIEDEFEIDNEECQDT